MIERIFIPTVHRVDNQITYTNLPDKWKSKVTMVVQAWEREQYTYDCDYLVLPDTQDYHYSDYFCLPRTRRFIYEAGKNMKYCVYDDSNMDTSKRFCTTEDFEEMFSLFDEWLDDYPVCGCAQIENPPSGVKVRYNTSISSAFFINGTLFKDILPELDLTSVRVGEDACFLLSLLSRGYKNCVSDEFVRMNVSNSKKMPSTVWDQQTYDQTLADHKYLEQMFPGIYSIVYDENGERAKGGYKDFGKSKIEWSKAYKQSQKRTLEKFFE